MYIFQTQCQPHITEAAKSSVEGICKKMYTLSTDYAQKVKEKNSEILKEANISGIVYPIEDLISYIWFDKTVRISNSMQSGF